MNTPEIEKVLREIAQREEDLGRLREYAQRLVMQTWTLDKSRKVA